MIWTDLSIESATLLFATTVGLTTCFACLMVILMMRIPTVIGGTPFVITMAAMMSGAVTLWIYALVMKVMVALQVRTDEILVPVAPVVTLFSLIAAVVLGVLSPLIWTRRRLKTQDKKPNRWILPFRIGLLTTSGAAVGWLIPTGIYLALRL